MAKRKQQSEDKKKQQFVPMLPDGLPDAIRNVRLRKGMTQAQAAEKGGVEPYKWSQYETRAKRLSIDELPIIKKGLGVSRTDLWNERYETERPYYEGPAPPDEIREDAPRYGMPMVTAVLQSLFAMDSEKLPLKWQKTFNDRRNGLLNSFANDLREADDLKQFYALTKTDDGGAVDAEAGDPEDPE